MAARRRLTLGPGILVTAAFIGPGTVTTASQAGAGFGYAVAWALAFAVLATIVLQEMSARLGLVTREGLGEALRTTFHNKIARLLSVFLVLAAIAFGNAAFEMGNIAGAALGAEVITGVAYKWWVLVIGASAFGVLACGAYRIIERLLIAMVVMMSLVFLVTAIRVQPSMGEVARGMFVPTLPTGSLTTIIALIGTTVVPYNLFLHASAVRERWPASMNRSEAIRASRFDTVLSVALGGFVTLAILVTAASCFAPGTRIESAGAMATQLEPLLGKWAGAFFASGLLAAGLTSAITAPLAAAYATAGAIGWSTDLRSRRFRAVWALIVIVGTGLALAGYRPIHAIIVAQAANGILLPFVAVFLLVVMNRRDLLGEHTNGWRANVLGIAVVVTAAGLGAVKIDQVLGFWPS